MGNSLSVPQAGPGDISEDIVIGGNSATRIKSAGIGMLLWMWKYVFKMLLNGKRKLQNSKCNMTLIL